METTPQTPAPRPPTSKSSLALLLAILPPLTLLSGIPLLFLAAPVFIIPSFILAILGIRQAKLLPLPGAKGKGIVAIILNCVWSVLYAALLWLLQGLGS